ncbi:hypothetical protein [Alteromonas sp. CYL-A6]|uniref:hypothetical protein n=1 Tax=Alteromonas nitratireducens TaxID=3390813 RepID=UPI0034C008DF
MNKLKTLVIPCIALLLLSSCSKSAKLFEAVKEEGVTTTTGWGLDSLLQRIDFDYLFSFMEENRVHSVRSGKGIQLEVKQWQSKMTLYIEPVDGPGTKRRVYEKIHILPGNYVITANIGTASLPVSLQKNSTLNYFSLAGVLKADASKGVGRLSLNINPHDAHITIYGTPHKYHKGMRLPEGEYRIKASKPGFEDIVTSAVITKDSLTMKTLSLRKRETSLERTEQVTDSNKEVITVVGSKSNQKLPQHTTKMGQLIITPMRDDVVYEVVDEKGKVVTYSTDLELPAGTYQVFARRGDGGLIIEESSVEIIEGQAQRVSFDLQPLPYQTELDVTLIFNFDELYRERVEIIFTPEDGEAVSFTDRMGRRGIKIETTLLNGNYKGELVSRAYKFDLGTITVSEGKANNFEFVPR